MNSSANFLLLNDLNKNRICNFFFLIFNLQVLYLILTPRKVSQVRLACKSIIIFPPCEN